MKKILFILVLLTQAAFAQQRNAFYVSPSGNDNNNGTQEQPFKSIQSALNALVKEKQKNGFLIDTTYIWLGKGTYSVNETIKLNEKASGLIGAPLVIAGMKGEKVIFTGAASLNPKLFVPIKDKNIRKRLLPEVRNKVLVADLRKAGIDKIDDLETYGNMNIKEMPQPNTLFVDNNQMQIARWPNEGYSNFGKVTEIGSIPRFYKMSVAPGDVPIDPTNPPAKFAPYINDTTNRGGTFKFVDKRAERWTQSEDLWLYGWWMETWASQAMKVKNIDIKKQEISLSFAHHYGLGDNGKFYAFNLLEELDQPGEYYIDRKRLLIYFMPKEALTNEEIVISVSKNLAFHLDNASNIIFKNIEFNFLRWDALLVEGGSKNKIIECKFKNLNSGISIKNGRTPSSNNLVFGNDFSCISRRALVLEGGDKRTLTPAYNVAENNTFHHGANFSINGVGNIFRHNLSHDNPSNNNWNGNDHLVEYNEFSNNLSDADDFGDLHPHGNVAGRGTICRYNFFRDIYGRKDLLTGVSGIYLDGGTSGQIIYGNVFYKTGMSARAPLGGIFIHGGKENIISNNIFVDCPIAIGISGWKPERWKFYLKSLKIKNSLYEQVNILDSTYQNKYPKLANLPNDAAKNYIHNNLMVNCQQFIVKGKYYPDSQQDENNNWETNQDPGFVDYTKKKFTLRPDAEVFRRIPEFKAIPFEKIGLLK